jgi:hypothetical protein
VIAVPILVVTLIVGLIDMLLRESWTALYLIVASAILTVLTFKKPEHKGLVFFNAALLYVGLLVIQAVFVGATATGGKIEETVRLREKELPGAYPSIHPQTFIDISPAFPEYRALPLPVVSGEPVHPLSGLANVPTVYCIEDDGWMVFDADDHGYTNPPGLNGPVDAIIVGDSFVQGACVGTGYSFVDTIRKGGLDIYNLGMGGSGPLTNLAQIVENIDRLSPRLVVWVHFAANDIKHPKRNLSDLDFEMSTESLRAYLEDPGHRQNLTGRKREIDRALKPIVDARIDARMRYAGLRRWTSFVVLRPLCEKLGIDIKPLRAESDFEAPDDVTRLETFEKAIRRAKSVAQGRGAKLVFVYLPWRWEIEDNQKDGVLDIMDRYGIDSMDLAEVLAAHDELWVTNGGHLSRSGNAAVGEAIGRFLAGIDTTATPK